MSEEKEILAKEEKKPTPKEPKRRSSYTKKQEKKEEKSSSSENEEMSSSEEEENSSSSSDCDCCRCTERWCGNCEECKKAGKLTIVKEEKKQISFVENTKLNSPLKTPKENMIEQPSPVIMNDENMTIIDKHLFQAREILKKLGNNPQKLKSTYASLELITNSDLFNSQEKKEYQETYSTLRNVAVESLKECALHVLEAKRAFSTKKSILRDLSHKGLLEPNLAQKWANYMKSYENYIIQLDNYMKGE